MRMLGRWESDGLLMVLALVHSLNATRNKNGRRVGNWSIPSIQLEKESMRLTLTMMISSPFTVTSGLRKCRSAVIAAIDAQSNMFPQSSRK